MFARAFGIFCGFCFASAAAAAAVAGAGAACFCCGCLSCCCCCCCCCYCTTYCWWVLLCDIFFILTLLRKLYCGAWLQNPQKSNVYEYEKTHVRSVGVFSGIMYVCVRYVLRVARVDSCGGYCSWGNYEKSGLRVPRQFTFCIEIEAGPFMNHE